MFCLRSSKFTFHIFLNKMFSPLCKESSDIVLVQDKTLKEVEKRLHDIRASQGWEEEWREEEEDQRRGGGGDAIFFRPPV